MYFPILLGLLVCAINLTFSNTLEPLSLILGFTRFTKLYSEIVSNKFVNILGRSYKQRSILMQIHHFPVFVQSRNHSENVVIPSKFLFYVVALKATKHGIMSVSGDNLHSKSCACFSCFFVNSLKVDSGL